MKTVKVIITILVVLTVIFFGTGLIIKETDYTAKVEVSAPLNKTFATFNDMKLIKNWIPEIISIDTVNYNQGRTGSIFEVTVTNPDSAVIKMREHVKAYVENEKLTLFWDAESMLKTDDYTFKEVNGKSLVTLNATCQSDSFILSCLFPYFKGRFQTMDQTYLDNFKNYIEKN